MIAYYILIKHKNKYVVEISCSTKRDLATEAGRLRGEGYKVKAIKAKRFEYLPGEYPKKDAEYINV